MSLIQKQSTYPSNTNGADKYRGEGTDTYGRTQYRTWESIDSQRGVRAYNETINVMKRDLSDQGNNFATTLTSGTISNFDGHTNIFPDFSDDFPRYNASNNAVDVLSGYAGGPMYPNGFRARDGVIASTYSVNSAAPGRIRLSHVSNYLIEANTDPSYQRRTMKKPMVIELYDAANTSWSAPFGVSLDIGEDAIVLGSASDPEQVIVRLNGTTSQHINTDTLDNTVVGGSESLHSSVGCGRLITSNLDYDNGAGKLYIFMRKKSETSTSPSQWVWWRSLHYQSQPFVGGGNFMQTNDLGFRMAIGHGRIVVAENPSAVDDPNRAPVRFHIFNAGSCHRIRTITLGSYDSSNRFIHSIKIGNGLIYIGTPNHDQEHEDRVGTKGSTVTPVERGRIWVYTLDGKLVGNYYGAIASTTGVNLPNDMEAKYGFIAMTYDTGTTASDSELEIARVTCGVNGILETYHHTNFDPLASGFETQRSYAPTGFAATSGYTGEMVAPYVDHFADNYGSDIGDWNGASAYVGINGDQYGGSTGTYAFHAAGADQREVVTIGNGMVISVGFGGQTGAGTNDHSIFQLPKTLGNYYEDKLQRRSYKREYWMR